MLAVAIALIVYSEYEHKVGITSDLMQFAGVVLYICCCSLTGWNSAVLFFESDKRIMYGHLYAKMIERFVCYASLICGISVMIFGLLDLATVPYLVPSIIVIELLALAIVIPVDSGAMFRDRRIAVGLAIVVPLAFIVMLPLYLHARPSTNRTSAVLSLLSSISIVIGWIAIAQDFRTPAGRCFTPLGPGRDRLLSGWGIGSRASHGVARYCKTFPDT